MNPADLDIRYIARLARIHLTDQEISEFQTQLGPILDYVDQLKTPNTEGVEPTAHTMPLFDVLRPDLPAESLSPQAALQNAPRTAHGLFLVPKVVE